MFVVLYKFGFIVYFFIVLFNCSCLEEIVMLLEMEVFFFIEYFLNLFSLLIGVEVVVFIWDVYIFVIFIK